MKGPIKTKDTRHPDTKRCVRGPEGHDGSSGVVRVREKCKGAFNYYVSVLGGEGSKGKMLTCLSRIIEQQYQTRKLSFQ